MFVWVSHLHVLRRLSKQMKILPRGWFSTILLHTALGVKISNFVAILTCLCLWYILKIASSYGSMTLLWYSHVLSFWVNVKTKMDNRDLYSVRCTLCTVKSNRLWLTYPHPWYFRTIEFKEDHIYILLYQNKTNRQAFIFYSSPPSINWIHIILYPD